jgi:hypothetical protein
MARRVEAVNIITPFESYKSLLSNEPTQRLNKRHWNVLCAFQSGDEALLARQATPRTRLPQDRGDLVNTGVKLNTGGAGR